MATFNDPLGQAQDVKRCQLCPGKDRKSAAETCCNSCQVNLCKICVGNHVISDPDMKHDVVTFKFKKSEVIPPQCSFHDEEKCDKFCEQCDSPFCLKCLNSGAHKSHNVQSISEIYKSRQDKITKDNLELETEIAPVYDAILSEIETMTSNVLQQHEDRTQSIKNLGEKCHRLVENVIRRYANVLKERYSQDNKNLLTLKSEFQRLQSLIQSAIDEKKSILSSMDSSKLIHYISRNEDFINIPPTFELTVPNFTPVEITEQVLFKMIGEIPETIKSNIQGEVIRVVQPIVQVHSENQTRISLTNLK
ncbi:E3 ubiquitin-protein ligase TRIM45-like [Saccostrea cucullata]|uniref:E3 ubiquitin-protein ligase TRIM45-like n=1 Tax=Saccostrea cuccullata TaxID=36930 RepID=UPI002ED1638E